MKKLKELINSEYRFSKYQMLLILSMVFVFSGVFGFIYETIFYKIDLGYFVKRGSTFGPWIPIYGFGALFMTFICDKLRRKPWLVLILNTVVCGLLEFLTGYFLYNLKGIRLWNYYTEIWNFGNIGGYICLRSIAFFGVSGMLLIYMILPIIKYLCSKINVKTFTLISLLPALILVIDLITYIFIG